MALAVPRQVDVLIAGAGPAGLAAAHALTLAGVHALLVDARARIGHPVRCAEATHRGFFDDLGVTPRREWVRWVLGKGQGGLILDRPRLEHDLAEILARAGAVVRAGTAVIGVGPYAGGARSVTLLIGHDRHDVQARLVIAADGVASRVAALAGLNTRLKLSEIGSCLACRVVGTKLRNPAVASVEYLTEIAPGYFWVFPAGPDQANVGLGVLGHRGFAARPLLDRALERTPALRGGRVVEMIVGCVPSAEPLERPYCDGLLVAGAAARLVGAASGEGLRPAAISGRAAARVYLDRCSTSTDAACLAPYRESLTTLYREMHQQLQERRGRERPAR